MKTRAKGSIKTSAEESASAKSAAPKVQLCPESSNPSQIFILPKDISTEARIITLENPRYLVESRYVACPERGFYEITKVAAPNATPRSWLLSAQESESANRDSEELVDSKVDAKDPNLSKGYITKAATMFVATPVDPVFFVLPALAPLQTTKGSESSKKLFLSGEDYLDRIGSASPQFNILLRKDGVRTLLEARMAAVCDTVDVGGDTMYRMNEEKLLKELMSKAKKMIKNGLPASMEEKLVRKALEAPMLSIKREESSMQEPVQEEEDAALAESGILTPATESADSQITVSTAATSFSEASTAATSFSSDSTLSQKVEIAQPIISAPEGIADLLRLRTAFSFICSNYLPPHLTSMLKDILSSPETSPIDFTPLETHLAHLSKLRQDALAARSLGDMSRKRSILDDDEDESRAEKKRKKEEEEKRKRAGESRGVKNLKKVNTTGMKKMSDFFKKKA
jgi:hypothetical protein